MSTSAPMPYEDRESSTPKWVIVFVLLSLLLHAILILAIVLITRFVPSPKLDVPPPESSTVTLSLVPPPQRPFMPTTPQPNVPPKETPVESDNNTRLTSHSQTSRAPDSLMPDLVTKNDHASELQNSPNSPAKPKPPATPTPPTPKPAEQVQKTSPQPAKPAPKPPKPPKPPTPQVTKNPVDPATGLPVLPALDAPTLEPQTSANPASRPVVPPSMLPAVAANLQGRAGMSGEPSPEAMATELGKYKAKFYRAVGSRWYPQVSQQMQLLGVGMIRVQYTIYADGTIQTKVLEGGTGSMMLLQTISVSSIRDVSPFDPFTPGIIKELGGATSYTDDFTFSVYSP